MKSYRDSLRPGTRRGAALIIVLAFVVLLAGLLVAFFSSSILYRQISNSSANQAKVELFAQGAVDALVGDLKEEIAAGSAATFYGDRTQRGAIVGQNYQPLNVAASVPALALKGAQTGVTTFAPNLVKRSAYQQNFYPAQPEAGAANYTGSTSTTLFLPSNGAAPGPSPTNYTPSKRAANLSTKTPSQNGRYISAARWNKALLLPKDPANLTKDTDLTPDSTAFVPPDWILVARDGSNPGSPSTTASFSGAGAVSDPSVSNNGCVIGRYAYAVYDEGGLLDANVAGFPASDVPPYTAANSDLNATSSKSALAFADLTQLPGISALSPTRQQAVINNLIGWRNYATAQPGGTLSGGFTYSGPQLTKYSNGILGNLTGFLKTSNTDLFNNQTDRMFSSRQELMRLLLNGIAQSSTERANVQTALQYLGTFSRELNQPSYIPPLHYYYKSSAKPPQTLAPSSGGTAAAGFDKEINPNYQTVRVSKAFTRSDQMTPAVVGEPLVNKRFPLQRLAWLTYKGPSQKRSQTDPDIKALIDAGIPYTYLQLGTEDNIKFYFGLDWDGTAWNYRSHNNFFNGAASGGRGPIMRVGRNPAVDPSPDPTRYVQDLAAPRDPDFFELLKSALTVGSLGKALLTSTSGAGSDAEQPYNYGYSLEASVDHQVMQIGANIINQFRADNYPVQIVFDDHQGNLAVLASTTTITGVANLPYLYNVIDGVLQLDPSKASGTNSDGAAVDQLPRSRAGSVYTGNLGTGTTGGSSGYKKGDKVTSSGVVALMAMPVIWNPHDPSSSQGATGLSPTNFRVVADSTTPDQVPGTARNTFFVYGQSKGTNIGDASGNGDYYSCYADANSPGDTGGGSGGNAWYRDATSNGLKIGHPLNASNTEIDLTVTGNGNNRPLFPEPTMLVRPQTVTDSNGNSIKVSVGASHLMTTDPAVKGFLSNGGLKSFSANPLNMQSGEVQDPAGTPYLGFYLGASPMSWLVSEANALSASAVQNGCILARVTGSSASSGAAPGSPSACYLTYRMQYQDPSGNWITYDTKYGNVAGISGFNFGCGAKDASLMAGSGGPGSGGRGAYWSTATDPRTNRFGLFSHYTGDSLVAGAMGNFPAPEAEGQWDLRVKMYAAEWLDAANGVMYTVRPDGQPGYQLYSTWPASGGTTASGWMAWVGSDGSFKQGIAPGLLSQNNTDIFSGMTRVYGSEQGNDIHTPSYFADPDGIVRRGMGAFVPSGTTASPTYFQSSNFHGLPSADTTVGLPMARAFGWSGFTPASPSPTQTAYNGSGSQVTSQAQSRPYFLHRPFRSVAELGHVFSDTPWRNLDFFTSESGSVALLDVFCINDTTSASPLVAGKVNLNTRQAPVLQAVLAGGYLDTAQPTFNGVTGRLDTVTAKTVAAALVARTTDVTNNANGTGPLQNVSDLVGKWIKNMAIGQLPVGNSPSGLSTNQGTLASPVAPNQPNPSCYDGKLSYAGFSGGVWDNTSTNLSGTARKPFINGVEDFSTASGNPKPTGTAMDVYSAYMNSATTFPANTPDKHNGPKETAGYVQRFREAPIRALAASGQTRVWNLMVDLVAQTGRYPSNASDLSKFVVEGEQRYWVHLAIDRYTGNVIDKQIEVVKE